MGKESSLWAYVRKHMSKRWHATRHEDNELGIADVSFACDGNDGWIELKVINAWPKRGGVLRVPHFTSWQKRWLKRRGKAGGGRVFLFMRVERDYMLFPWTCVDNIDETDMTEMFAMAAARWIGKVDWFEFESVITTSYHEHR